MAVEKLIVDHIDTWTTARQTRSTAGRSTLMRFGKGLPIAGGFVGAGLDTYLIRRIADAARREFPAVS